MSRRLWFYRNFWLCWFNIQRELNQFCLLNVFSYITLAMSNQTQLICDSLTKKSTLYLYWFLRYQTFRIPSKSYWLREFWIVSQDLQFCQTLNLGWEVKYHNNSPFRLFSEIQTKNFLKNNIKCRFLLSLPKFE